MRKMQKKKRNMTQRLSLTALCLVILAYSVFHLASLFSPEISTIVVGMTTETDTLAFDGYVFCDEQVLTSPVGGAVDYVVADGDRVTAGTPLATVYRSELQGNVQDSIEALDRQILRIETSIREAGTLSGLSAVKESLAGTQDEIAELLATGNLEGLSAKKEEMLSGMCRVSVLTDPETPLHDTLARLKEQRQALMNTEGEAASLSAPHSGYFYAGTDGYEGVFTAGAAENLTWSSFRDLKSMKPTQRPDGFAVGRLLNSSEWRLVAAVPQSQAQRFEVEKQYDATFTGNDDKKMPLTLERMIAGEGETLLVFLCDRLPPDFDFSRTQSVEITMSSVSGIYVPESSTHRKNGEYYVYILRGGVVLERRIEIDYEGSDYFLVRDGMPDEEEVSYLQSNDQLILNGSNLFDGRILD